ncbi:uncharacterized protein LOC127763618 [Oryza glaberrima]|uniref:uncharacterized protein LOC127763618 n=1 Tax=Oryza glaberrima TaxID=4538 RepID=UPI00224BF55C|nr:uncharacterized protein LOC127763618 [Oryza glaberrima]
MYLLLKHCLKLKLKRGSVRTDNKLLYELLLGSRSVNANDSTYRIIQLLRILIAKFEVLIPCWVPRELLFVADGIARVIKDFEANLLEGQHINDEAVKIEAKRSVMQFLASYSDQFQGSAVFRFPNSKFFNRFLQESKNKLIGFSEEEMKEFLSRVEHTFYLNVGNEEGAKFKVVNELLETLRRFSFSVIISSEEMKNVSAKNFIDDLYGRFETDHHQMDCCTIHNFLCLENSLPGKKKKLVVVAGSDVLEDCYADSRACSIILSLPHEVQKLEMRGIIEVNVETFAFFNGAVFDTTRLYDKKSRKK